MRSLYNRPILLLTLTSFFWAGNFVLGRAIVGVIPPVTLACFRWAFACLLFLPFAWTYVKQDAAKIVKNWRIILFLGLIGPCSFNTVSYLGLTSTQALNGLVLNAAGPMMIALVAWLLFRDRLDLSQIAGMTLGFLGVLLILVQGNPATLSTLQFNIGDLIIIAAMLLWSIYTACLRLRPNIHWQSFNVLVYGIAAIGNLPFAFVEHALGHTMQTDAATVACIAYVAIFPSLIAYIFYNRGVELIGPARAGIFLFLVPVFGAVFAMTFLGEKLHPFHAIGFAVIIAGVLLGTRSGLRAPAVATRPGE